MCIASNLMHGFTSNKIKYSNPKRTKFPTYGRYCGGNYTGGKVGGTDTTLRGVDKFDEACRAHDIAYQNSPNGPKSVLDLGLAGVTHHLMNSNELKKLSPSERSYVRAMRNVMASKGALLSNVNAAQYLLDRDKANRRTSRRRVFKLNGKRNNDPFGMNMEPDYRDDMDDYWNSKKMRKALRLDLD